MTVPATGQGAPSPGRGLALGQPGDGLDHRFEVAAVGIAGSDLLSEQVAREIGQHGVTFNRETCPGPDNLYAVVIEGVDNLRTEYAGKRVRHALVVVDLVNRRPVEIVHAEFAWVAFDSEGRLDR